MTNNFEVDFYFNEPPKLEEIRWSILVGKGEQSCAYY